MKHFLGSLTLMQNKIDSLMNFYIRISEFCLNDSELDIKICVCYYKKKRCSVLQYEFKGSLKEIWERHWTSCKGRQIVQSAAVFGP